MKRLAMGFLVLGCLFGALAQAEEADLEIAPTTELRFTHNFDRKIKALENYSVTFSDDKPTKPSASPSRDGLELSVIAAK